ncbi:unnamed protein product [Polarella glacialis]|uniref:Uncharacterized protein n=1 Tax=Polarella glacialis TaxID=89957 RepID=A0A813I9R3_POLGL|nr:unnamed protein product [Polarella glacialis]
MVPPKFGIVASSLIATARQLTDMHVLMTHRAGIPVSGEWLVLDDVHATSVLRIITALAERSCVDPGCGFQGAQVQVCRFEESICEDSQQSHTNEATTKEKAERPPSMTSCSGCVELLFGCLVANLGLVCDEGTCCRSHAVQKRECSQAFRCAFV